MKCLVRTNNLSLPAKIRKQMVERIEKSFARMSSKIRFVVVSFQDIKGFRGNKDKRCSLKVVADGVEQVEVFDADSSHQGAFNLALKQAKKRFIEHSRNTIHHIQEPTGTPKVSGMKLLNGAS